MGAIHIHSTPSGHLTDNRFPDLSLRSDALAGASLGGRFALPLEFDQSKHASAFVHEGNDVAAYQQVQPVVGTGFTAEGWQIWRYPEHSLQPETDDKGNPKKDPKSGEIIYKKHPLAGQPHKVQLQEKVAQALVLMFRPIEVQKQVNEVYGLVSLERMTYENQGGTIGGNVNQDSGMLTEDRLAREIGHEREIEEMNGRSAVVHSSLTQMGGRLGQGVQRVSR